MKGLLFDAETNEFRTLETNNDNLQAWYDAIGCRCIDIIRRKVGKMDFEVVIDDEGWLLDRPVPTTFDMTSGRPMLAGTIIFYGGVDAEGNLTDITDEGVKTIKSNLVSAVFTDGTVKTLIKMGY